MSRTGTSRKVFATLVFVAKAAALFTAGRYALDALPESFPAQMWLLKPLVWIVMAAVFSYLVIPPFLRVVQPSLLRHTKDPESRHR